MRLIRRTPAWAAFLSIGCAAIAAYYLVPSSVGQALVYDGLNLAAVLAILWRLAQPSVGGQGHWAFIAAGAMMILAGNVAWDVYELLLDEPPFPSLADVFFLAEYPLLATGFLLMIRGRGRADRTALLDSLIVASAASAMAWVFLVLPVTEASGMGPMGMTLSAAYPLMDVVLLATVVRLVAMPGRRSPSRVLLMASLLALIVGDTAFGIIGPLSLYATGSFLDVAWLFSFIALGAAALHPSAEAVGARQPATGLRNRGRGRLVALSAAVLGPGALLSQHVMGKSSLAVILAGSGAIVILILVRIAEQNRTEDALRSALSDVTRLSRQRQGLVDRIISAQEEERKLIAREIHDDSIQRMIAVKMRLEMILRHHPELNAIEDFDKLCLGTERSVKSLRALMFELRPYHLDSDGLAAALQLYLQEQRTLEGSPAMELDGGLDGEPSEEGRTVLYRIAQEAVTNARKHARASNIRVVLGEDERGHTLEVVDDGVGFASTPPYDSAPGHLGLTSMRERAEMVGGQMSLRSRPGEGTTVSVWVPRIEPPEDSEHTEDQASVEAVTETNSDPRLAAV
jgi:signal transduction histidine kinase